ncbi:hypothetical protein [Streptomyces collinus]|uniref:hypothetical protein n=1 Tax=Streptomyces collinus TaxID=42684 RepID=UPI0036356C07
MVRAAAAGTYTTRLSQGRTVTTRIAQMPGPITPVSWRLSVEDWQPGSSATRTEVTRHELTLTQLLPWSQLPELADAAGIGTYRTTLTLPEGWSAAHGAYLELRQVSDTCRVRVNGLALPAVDRINSVLDLGTWLRAGDNLIEIEVATPLVNRLRITSPAVFGTTPRQPYGLTGPVRVVP